MVHPNRKSDPMLKAVSVYKLPLKLGTGCPAAPVHFPFMSICISFHTVIIRSAASPGRGRSARLAVVHEVQVSWGKYLATMVGVSCLEMLSYSLFVTMLCISFTLAHPHAWWKNNPSREVLLILQFDISLYCIDAVFHVVSCVCVLFDIDHRGEEL